MEDRGRNARERAAAGRRAEQAALAHLQAHGLQLITRNYRCKAGEIDLVMLDGATLALVEVRYRADAAFGGAAASVTWRKQRHIVNAAQHLLLSRRELRRYAARFDVVTLRPGTGGLEVSWIKNAFRLGE
jgi:putative endonuclease